MRLSKNITLRLAIILMVNLALLIGAVSISNAAFVGQAGSPYNFIVAGWEHSVIVDKNGNVLTWGNNNQGQLGTSTTVASSSLPIQTSVSATIGTTVTAVSAGLWHTVALTASSTVWAWGNNDWGQLGNNSTTSSSTPVQAIGLTNIIAISAGSWHTAALDKYGKVWLWGRDCEGETDQNFAYCRNSTAQVVSLYGISDLTDIIKISAGHSHTALLQKRTENGITTYKVYGLGTNWAGQVKSGLLYVESLNEIMSTTDEITAIYAGYGYTLIATKEKVFVYGLNLAKTVDNLPSCASLGDILKKTDGSDISNIVALSGGNSHLLMLDKDGNLYALGFNREKQFGIDTPISTSKAILITDILAGNVTGIAAGYNHTIITRLLGNGVFGVFSAGENLLGQLGRGSSIGTASSFDFNVIAISDYNKIWGYVGFAPGVTPYNVKLHITNAISGTTSTSTISLPTSLGTSTYFLMVGQGTYTITPLLDTNPPGLDYAGVTYAFSPSSTTTIITSSATSTRIDFTGSFSGGTYIPPTVTISGSLKIGSTSIKISGISLEFKRNGVMKATTTTDANGAYSVPIPSDATSTVTVEVKGWPRYTDKVVTNSLLVNSNVVLDIPLTDRQVISAGGLYTMGIKKDKSAVYGWGYNEYGQLGRGTIIYATSSAGTTTDTTGLSILGNIVAISSGKGMQEGASTAMPNEYKRSHTLALTASSTVWAWGYSMYGQLGNNAIQNETLYPVQVQKSVSAGLDNIVAVSAGGSHSVAISASSTVWTWGSNSYGQLGTNTTNNIYIATEMPTSTISNVVAISAGENHTVSLKGDGTVWAWGLNGQGQLGNNSTNNSNAPVQVQKSAAFGGGNLSKIVAISAGNNHSLAIDTDGTVWAWGSNDYGQLGNNSTNDSSVAAKVGIAMIAISAGSSHSLAIKNDGTVWAWGLNNQSAGWLGTGLASDKILIPNPVSGFTGGVSAITAGGYHSGSLKSDGTIWTWGSNAKGQLGDTTTIDKAILPANVMFGNKIPVDLD